MEIKKVSVLSEPYSVWEIASAYSEAYGRSPWFEGYVCPVCRSSFGLDKELTICPKCMTEEKLINLIEYWPKSKIISDFYTENTKDGSICLVAKKKGNIVAFAWGYPLKISPESSNKIDAPGLENKITDSEVFYLDECAVLPKYQFQGIGKSLVKEFLRLQPRDKMFLRTLADSPMQKLVENLNGKKIMAISEGRVIMELIKFEKLQDYTIPPHY